MFPLGATGKRDRSCSSPYRESPVVCAATKNREKNLQRRVKLIPSSAWGAKHIDWRRNQAPPMGKDIRSDWTPVSMLSFKINTFI